MPVALHRTDRTAANRRSPLRRASEIPLVRSPVDLAAKLRLCDPASGPRLGRRDALLDIVRAVNTTLEPQAIAQLILDRAAAWVPVPCWAVVAGDLSGDGVLLADRGLKAGMSPAVLGVARLVMERGEDIVSANLEIEGRLDAAALGTVVAFPLTCRGRRVGALIGADGGRSGRRTSMRRANLQMLRLLLEPAAVALDNAMLLKRVAELSVTDDLTHLYNSRYLDMVLRTEIKRAVRARHPLSLLFVDLDGFKGINDTYGHAFGSRALVEAATVMRANVRDSDVVARFGGDEFSLVLPETGSAGALAVGERIRARLASHVFLAVDGLSIHVTASVGVATLPGAATTAETLLQAADAAMYQVKGRGKNGVQTALAPTDT